MTTAASVSSPPITLPATTTAAVEDSRTRRLQHLVLGLSALVLALLAGGLIGGGLWLWLRSDPFARTYPLSVTFANARGVEAGDAVMMAGIRVGKVERVATAGPEAAVRLRINNDAPIVHGSRFVAMPDLFSTPGGITILPPEESDGTMIRANAADLTGESGEDLATSLNRVNRLVGAFTRAGERSSLLIDETTRMTRAVRAVVGDEASQRDLRRTIASVRAASAEGERATAEMTALLRQTRPQIAAILGDVRATTKTASRLAARGDALLPAAAAAGAGKQIAGAVKDASATAANLRATSEKLDRLVAGTQALLGDPVLAADVKAISGNLRSATGRADRITGNAETLLADPALPGEMKELLVNLRQISETSKTLLDLLAKAAAAKK